MKSKDEHIRPEPSSAGRTENKINHQTFKLDHRLIPSLATLFQSSKYRTKRKHYCCEHSKYHHYQQKRSSITILTHQIIFIYIFLIIPSSSYLQWSVMANDNESQYSPINLIHHRRMMNSLNDHYSVTSSMDNATTITTMSNNNQNNQNCIPICQCKWKSGKETANCDHRSLLTVPNGLSTTTQVIDLSGNMLTQLPPMVFIQRGLINLQRIYLANCHLVEISAESFLKLSNLIELDLSNNSLPTIPSRSLAECPGLRRLSLAGNRIRDVKSRSFLPLTNLNWLDLSRNVIYHLDTDAFIGLRSLQVLKIESNHLQTIPSAQSFVQFLSMRVSLNLHDNQWRCDCHLKPFRDWIVANSIPMTIKPICMMPTRLQGQTWDTIPADEFSCPPTIHTVNTHFYKHIGNNVTITCSVSGFPLPRIFWLFESTGSGQINAAEDLMALEDSTRTKNGSESLSDFHFDNDDQQPVENEHYRQLLPSARYSIVQEREQMGVVASKLTVHALQPIDTQRITCYARNVGGAVMKNFTLIVSTQEPFSSSRSMDLLVSEFMLIVVSICILLMLLMLFLFVVIFRRKSSSTAGSGGGSTNHVTDSSTVPEPNKLGADTESEYRMLKSPPLTNGDLPNNTEKSIFMDQHPAYITHYNPHHPNGSLMAPTNILMVNTIDMFNTSANNGNAAAGTIISDPSISTDLSSQSTTATSMNGNGPTISPNTASNNQNTNSNDNGNSQVYYPTAFENNTNHLGFHQTQKKHCANISARNPIQSSQQPDILVSSNAYYLTTNATIGPETTQFPLLNSGPLFATSPIRNDHHHLIYGTTKIAPTRMIPATKVTKVKFADELESSLDSTSSSSTSNAYTIATLRRTNKQSQRPVGVAKIQNLNKPLGINHRSISSYPEGLRLVESSVDSGEPIQITEHLDETEEDDYYQHQQQ